MVVTTLMIPSRPVGRTDTSGAEADIRPEPVSTCHALTCSSTDKSERITVGVAEDVPGAWITWVDRNVFNHAFTAAPPAIALTALRSPKDSEVRLAHSEPQPIHQAAPAA